jgi:hypothetical protein
MALARLLHVCPDQYALAKFGIVDVWRGVRSWAPFQLADGVGWHARYVSPGVMLDFVYGWASGIERVVLMKLGVPQPDTPTHVYFSLGFVLLDSSGFPVVLPPTAAAALQPPVAVLRSPCDTICIERFLRDLSQMLAEGLPRVPAPSTAGGNIVASAGPTPPSCSTEHWLPRMYLPAHVPRRAPPDRMEQPRLSAETPWRNIMIYHEREMAALWSGVGWPLDCRSRDGSGSGFHRNASDAWTEGAPQRDDRPAAASHRRRSPGLARKGIGAARSSPQLQGWPGIGIDACDDRPAWKCIPL